MHIKALFGKGEQSRLEGGDSLTLGANCKIEYFLKEIAVFSFINKPFV